MLADGGGGGGTIHAYLMIPPSHHQQTNLLFVGRTSSSRRFQSGVVLLSLAKADKTDNSSNDEEEDEDKDRSSSSSSSSSPPDPPEPYRPSGMSLQDYQQLKQKEALQESQKNYGAWGPKFAQQTSRPPDGDWMVMRQLWTHGTVDGPSSTTSKSDQSTTSSRIGSFFRKIRKKTIQLLPAIILSVAIMDSILTAMALYQSAAELTILKIYAIVLRLKYIKWKTVEWSMTVFKLQLFKAVLTFATAPILDKYYLSRIQNRYNKSWSKRKIVILSCLGSLGLLSLWALLLLGLRKAGAFC
eukprot:scaffold6528_cov114-Cylindrotheca_fusiformis.AAC.6